MKIKKIGTDMQAVSRWSGGTTTQLAIYPESALYADRDFLWRVSSAVVELPESDFTPLPDYDRILMILEGELSLSHDDGDEYTLHALEQTAFDGASHTFSRGQVTDFNLMMRKGRCSGRVEARSLSGEGWKDTLTDSFHTHLIYCADGSVDVTVGGEFLSLGKGEAVLLECSGAAENCTVSGVATVILAEINCL